MASSQRSVCRTTPPAGPITSTRRAASYSIARPAERNELRFLVSVRVPSFLAPRGVPRCSRRSGATPPASCSPICRCTVKYSASSRKTRPLFGRAHVRLGDDLDQRHARAVVVHASRTARPGARACPRLLPYVSPGCRCAPRPTRSRCPRSRCGHNKWDNRAATSGTPW